MNLNNKVKPINAAFAQPSGISFNNTNQLFIADSEVKQNEKCLYKEY